jgi:predicted GTPase
MNYEEYKRSRIELSDLVSQQYEITDKSEYDKAVNVTEKPSVLLKNTTTRLEYEQLRVLVMGKFSSGKSTFLNGLLGEVLLPAKATPTTAVIGEIRYAEKSEITLLPKKGKWKGGDEPFSIKKEELKDYIIIDNMLSHMMHQRFSCCYMIYRRGKPCRVLLCNI